MRSYFDFWRRYADFKGKTTVADFWLGLFFHFIVSFALFVLVAVFSTAVLRMENSKSLEFVRNMNVVYGLAWLTPFLAILARRMRDAGYSCRCFWWLLVPLIGLIAVISRLYSKSIEPIDEMKYSKSF